MATYLQKDGVSMRLTLGPMFTNTYMCLIENNVLSNLATVPLVYNRYVNDILLVIKNIKTFDKIKPNFEEVSFLKFN